MPKDDLVYYEFVWRTAVEELPDLLARLERLAAAEGKA